MKVLFKTETFSFNAELNTSPAAIKIKNSLPLESEVSIWGDEIYFNIGIIAPEDGKTMDIEIGDVGYWPNGKCLCIFFGPTPASKNERPVPASHVVVIGKTNASQEKLRKIKNGERIRVEKYE